MDILICTEHGRNSCPPCWKYVCDLQDELDRLWNQRVDNIAMAITKPLGGITE